MRWPSLLPLLLLVGCTGGGGETIGATSTGDSSTSSGGETESASATTTTTSAGTGTATTDLTTWATTAATNSGTTTSSTSGEPTVSASVTVTSTTGPVTTEPTSELTTDEPTTTTGDTGGVDLCAPKVEGDACKQDSDCAIAGDCCSCVAYNPEMSGPGNCGGNCKQDRCSEWGLTEAACEAGICVVKGKSCNPDKVACDVVPPPCGDGTLPQVVGDCYSGACLSVDACDWVPGCELCKGKICNITEGPGCTHHRCIEPISECDGIPYCDCLGQIFCQPPHSQCSQDGDALVCGL
ncbi:MAG: hypothetical protein R3B09_12390 [Nannocystaceae bacterium]